MRSLLARLAVLGAFAVGMAACTNGSGGALPFAGPPNNSGGAQGQFQSGANNTALLRFVQGSPDYGNVDVCIDNIPFGVLNPAVGYGKASPVLYAVAGGISHTIAVFQSDATASDAGLECPTAPGPYLGKSPIVVSTISAGVGTNALRETIVLGGTAASSTLGLYVFAEPGFPIAPAGSEVISHNAAPVFSTGKAQGVGFGQCTTTVTPCTVPVNLTGAQAVAAPKKSSVTAVVLNSTVTSGINAIPAGFYDGAGVPAGTVVPITSIAAPNEVAGQPYVIQLYAIDAAAGGLNLVPVVEQTLGYGF